MSALLPVGTFVRVVEQYDGRTYIGKVVGYDLGRTKYSIGMRFPGWDRWLFAAGGSWAFLGEVEQISEEEATKVEVGR